MEALTQDVARKLAKTAAQNFKKLSPEEVSRYELASEALATQKSEEQARE